MALVIRMVFGINWLSDSQNCTWSSRD